MELLPLFSNDYLRSVWKLDYEEYLKSGEDASLIERLNLWSMRNATLTETQIEGQFCDIFFKQIWGYWGTGERETCDGFCLSAKYGVAGAGQTGGKGSADLALGWFGSQGLQSVAQVDYFEAEVLLFNLHDAA